MQNKDIIKISKFLSLVLRHKPQTIDLHIGEQGWANTEELLQKINAHGISINMTQLVDVVENNDKKRFAFSPDKKSIRASQGHSLKIDLGYTALEPPEFLFHGTATRNLLSIRKKGIINEQNSTKDPIMGSIVGDCCLTCTLLVGSGRPFAMDRE